MSCLPMNGDTNPVHHYIPPPQKNRHIDGRLHQVSSSICLLNVNHRKKKHYLYLYILYIYIYVIYLVFHQSSHCQFCFTHITGAILFRTLQLAALVGLRQVAGRENRCLCGSQHVTGPSPPIFWALPHGEII